MKLTIDPPLILPWLSITDRQSNILLLDLEADLDDINDHNRMFRIDLNVIFNPQPIRCGKINRADWYIGSTGAEILVHTNNGEVADCTGEKTLSVDYSNSSTRNRRTDLTLKPNVRVTGEKGLNATPFEITKEASSQQSFCASFSSTERLLSATIMRDSVKWVISSPRGEKVIQDFLTGNLYLHAKFIRKNEPTNGFINIRPSDLLIFNNERRPAGTLQSLLILYKISKNGQKLLNRDGFQISFKESRDE